MRSELFFEIIVIGLITVIFMWASYFIVFGKFPDTDVYKMVLASFLVGASMHFLFEIFGVNQYWCEKTFPGCKN